jgi:carboxylesterase type B
MGTLRIHGGSFSSGAATSPGLDGSALALSSGVIVVTVQYRLGVLGWLPPTTISSGINLGVKDVKQALTFLNKVLPSFGGAPNQITLAGQSSGAAMIRGELRTLYFYPVIVRRYGITDNGWYSLFISR